MDIDTLNDFSKAAPPTWASCALAPAKPEWPDHLRGTNVEFLVRLAIEGDQTLHDPKTLDAHSKFTAVDIARINAGAGVMLEFSGEDAQTIMKGTPLPPMTQDGTTTLLNAFFSAGRIAAYYPGTLKPIDEDIDETAKKLQRLTDKFKQACHAKDYGALARMYPDHDTLLQFHVRPDIAGSPEGTISFRQRRYEQEKAKAMKYVLGNKGFLTTESVTAIMKNSPPAIRDLTRHVLFLEGYRARNSGLHEGITVFLSRFKAVLSDAPAAIPLIRPVQPPRNKPSEGESAQVFHLPSQGR